MKKVFILALISMFVVATHAQIVSSRSTGITREKVENNNWSTLYLQWNPSSAVPSKGDSKTFTGFSIGYNKAIGLTQQAPLYLEFGLGVQYSYRSDTKKEVYNTGYGYQTYELDEKFSMLSAKVPFQLDYVYNIPNTSVDIIPNAGLDFRFNILGKIKYEGGGYSESRNLFDKDDMGGDDYTWNRFQVGWHIGLNARFNKKYLLGVSYGTDFSEIAKEVKIHTTSVTLGLCF